MVRNTKAKVRRTLKNYGIDLSGVIETPSIEEFSTRKEFNEWKNRQSSFTNRANTNYQFVKNDYGVVSSKRRINEIDRKIKLAQKQVDEFNERVNVNKLPFISGGKQQGTVADRERLLGKNDVVAIRRPLDFNFEDIKTPRELSRQEEKGDRISQPEYFDKRLVTMKENFITILELSFNSDADLLVEEIKNIPPDDFYEMYKIFDEFDFMLYDSEGQDVEADEGTIKQMLSYVEMYKKKLIDMDFKSFG